MNNQAIISGSYADLKTIKTRQVLQMVIEVPLEEGEQLIKAFGFPAPGAEIRVVVARLISEVVTNPKGGDAHHDRPANTERSQHGKTAYATATDGGKAVTRCAILCDDDEFQKWSLTLTKEDAAAYVRQCCKIHSRRELATDYEALRRFLSLETDFLVAVGRMAEPR